MLPPLMIITITSKKNFQLQLQLQLQLRNHYVIDYVIITFQLQLL
jgi:hypothetical protein